MTTDEIHDDAWAWPCPYCGTSNAIEAAVCVRCHAQLRDPQEDDLFTTVATENAHVVDPDSPRVREMLWSTEVPPEEVVAEAVAEPPEDAAGSLGPPAGMASSQSGPFTQSSHSTSEPDHRSVFGAGQPGTGAVGSPGDVGDVRSGSPFGPERPPWVGPDPEVRTQEGAQAFAARPSETRDRQPPVDRLPPEAQWPGEQWSESAAPGQQWPRQESYPQERWSREQFPDRGPGDHTHQRERVTPDENGLSIAIESLDSSERERCVVPIGVCGALLGEQEVVLGVLAGYLMGHSAVLMVTNTRILVGNSRRWKPLLDQFLPSADLMVHLRHDRDVASLTIVSGDRLTTVDGITDVTGAVELAERMRAMATRTS